MVREPNEDCPIVDDENESAAYEFLEEMYLDGDISAEEFHRARKTMSSPSSDEEF